LDFDVRCGKKELPMAVTGRKKKLMTVDEAACDASVRRLNPAT
jgi:hypothetical protein